MLRIFAAVLVSACAASPPAPPTNRIPSAPPRASGVSAMQLIEHPPPLGTEVTVDVYEPILDSSGSSVPQDGELEVQIHSRKRFVIAPGTTAAELRAGALAALPSPRSPIRVRGVLAADRDPDTHEAGSVRLVARVIEPLALPQPTRRASTQELQLFDTYVEVEGTYTVGFEWTTLDGTVWLDFYPQHRHTCIRGPAGRVRVTGFAHAGGGYGHMGHYQSEIVVTELVEWKPDCATR
ncbi:MAG: hypothetical protein ABI867_42195 [Kofleriaceae bacterium]